jgi:hypothetical protein
MGKRLAAHLTFANVMAATAVFIVVEEEKTGADCGRYLTPEVFGKPASQAIGAGG